MVHGVVNFLIRADLFPMDGVTANTAWHDQKCCVSCSHISHKSQYNGMINDHALCSHR